MSATLSMTAQPPLVLHLIYRLAVGGLENGLINLINRMPPERYRHVIVCLTETTDFQQRLERDDVCVMALHKRAGNDTQVYAQLWRILRQLRPQIVHTRNLPTMEYAVLAACAGVPGRIHGEHGRDIYDLDGSKVKYNLLRRLVKPFVHRYITVSANLANWLVHTIGVGHDRVVHIYNGVDMQRFVPRSSRHQMIGPEGFAPPGTFVVGTVGRMEAVKDQLTLVRSFLHLLQTVPQARERARLVLIGEGPLREASQQLLCDAGVAHLAWLPGERHDVPAIMRTLDLFILPSLAEGISNTILEAMASGLPVIATQVGGNPELVEAEQTGMLVPPADPAAMAEAISTYFVDAERCQHHGQAARRRVETCFSMQAMVDHYLHVYDTVLA
jgi:sugar transferase (PEP-CTERM/EpsH1 system associated)